MLFAFLTCLLFTACESTKKNTALPATEVAALKGNWELTYITGPRIVFNGLYPNKKPTIVFDVANNTVGGNTGCNSYSSTLKASAGNIDFTLPMAVTQMMCAEEALGENTYLQMLKKVNRFYIADTTLNFMNGPVVLMRFSKR